MINIGIIGQGFVGNAIYQKFKKYYKVLTYDLNTSKCNTTKQKLLKNSEIIFVCLPTPMNTNGSCNLNIVESVINELNII